MGDLQRLVEQHYANFGAGNLEADRGNFSPDVETEVPGGPPMKGFEAFKAFAGAWTKAFPDGGMKILTVVESGDTAIAEGLMTGTHTGPLVGPAGEVAATGRKIEFKFADVFKVRDGMVVEHRVYFDQMVFLGQLGLIPSPTGA
jgi:predicted ester cyclase